MEAAAGKIGMYLKRIMALIESKESLLQAACPPNSLALL